MLCYVCKEKAATFHLTEIAAEKIEKFDLCEDCAKQKGVKDPTGFSLAELMLGLSGSLETKQNCGGGIDGQIQRRD